MMHRKRKMLFVIGPLAILAMAGFVFGVMSLWNWLVPALFGGKLITYWQALGILVLSRILVGGLGGHRGGGHRKFVTGWNQLSPEEQEKFRTAMKARGCGPAPEAQA
jgi:hypothetical protein